MRRLLSLQFWAVRMVMFGWGFATTYYFTGNLITSFKVFIVQAIGNTIIMLFVK